MVQIVAVCLGGGLMTLSLIAAVGWFIQRFILRRFARSRRPELFQLRGRFDPALVRGMISPSLRAWGTTLGGLVVLNSDQFFIASLSGVTHLPAYRAAYLVLYNLYVLSILFGGVSAVFISHLWQAGEISEIHRIVVRNLRIGLGLMAAGGACILLLGPASFRCLARPGEFHRLPGPCHLLRAAFPGSAKLHRHTRLARHGR